MLERMHASELMRLLLGSHDFLSGRFTRDEVQDIHRTITQLILATDMARHLEITSLFNACAVSGNLEGGKSDRLLVLQMMLKMADISNPTRRWVSCQRWAKRVMEEFFRGRQGV
eukprot:m51a1_g7602 putative 3 5 -cyclic nucleotide phosphodiesterase family protein (114) ;mRNA; f:240676-241017